MATPAAALVTERFCVPNTTEGCGYGLCNAQGTYCLCFPGYVEGKLLGFDKCALNRPVWVSKEAQWVYADMTARMRTLSTSFVYSVQDTLLDSNFFNIFEWC